MQDVIQEFTIGFFDSSGVFSIYMKQDDTDRVIKFHIMDNAEDYREFLSNPYLIITVREQLPSGDMLPDIPIDKQDLDLETMSLTIHVTKAMLQQSGIANCELMFSSIEDGLIITTVPFKLIIEESFMTIPNDSTQIEFDNWTELYIALRSMQDQVESGETFRVENENERISQENARQAAEAEREHVVGDQVKQAEAWAKGTRDGVPVETSDEAYHNNSRYYSELAENDKNAADEYSEKSEAYAVGKRNGVDVPDTDETYHNNSKYYRDQAAAIMAELDGTIRAQGTCTFAELPAVAAANPGDMWNVSDEFVTTSDFREGAGKVIPMGSNVYMTVSAKWDVLSGSPVAGVKGNKEDAYRKGNVNITPENVGAVNEDGGDTADTIVTYRGYDEQIDYEVRTEVTIKGTVADGLTGYKNILTYPYFDSSKSENGLTFVDNKDGSITVNGICTEECYFNFFAHAIHPTLQRGSRIKLALRVISGTITSKYIEAWCRTNTGGTYPTSYSSGVLRDVGVITSNSFPCSQYSDGQDSISVLFPNNVVCNNVVFDCMLMYDDEDETFVRASTIPPLASGEQHKVLFSKISAMFANIRKLWNTVTHNYYATYNNKSIPFRFGIDANGNYGYYKDGADTVTPFKTVVNLGTGTSFNVSNITGYKKFTKDNFYIVCTSASGSSSSIGKQNGQWWTPGDYRICYDMVVNYTGNTASATIGKTYNQSTGVLTLSNMSASAGTSISGKVWSGDETHAYTSASGTVGVSIGYYVLLIY